MPDADQRSVSDGSTILPHLKRDDHLLRHLIYRKAPPAMTAYLGIGQALVWRTPMKRMSKLVIATSTFTFATLLSFGWCEQGGISLSVESAQARVGRPLTPMSVAGVARRQNRRAAYGYGAGVVGAGLAGAAAVGTAAAVAATSPNLGWGGAPYYTGTGYYGGAGYYGGPRYYGGPKYYGSYAAYGYPAQSYGARNGWVCEPGTMVKLDDGRMYPCQ